MAAWCSGDFNADGVVDVGDFNLWNGNKFTSANDVSAVPEPNCLVMASLAMFVLLRRGCRGDGHGGGRQPC